MTQRRLTIFLHWSILMLVLVMVKGGTSEPWVRWAFVIGGAIWVAMAMVRGMMCRPGPKLTGTMRAVYPWMHRGIYAVLAVTVALNAVALLGLMPHDTGWVALLVLLSAGALHGLFHFWRHNVLFDGALRIMTPRFMHKIL
jgi:cytochrome b561